MPFSIAVSCPLDLLALVPELVGFEPQRSLVLVAVRSGTTCGTLRVDLPGHAGSTDPAAIASYVSTLVGMACRLPGVDALLPVVVTDAACASGVPHADLLAQLHRTGTTAGFTMHDALFVAADGWGRAGRPPRPRHELDAARRLRRLDPDAAPVRSSPADEARLREADGARRRATAKALAALNAKHRPLDPVWFAEYSAQWRPSEVGPASAALAAHTFADPSARDVVLFTWSWGRTAGLRAHRLPRHGRGSAADDRPIAAALTDADGLGRPSVHRVEHGVQVLRRVAALLPSTKRAPCLASLAWLSWILGRGSLAGEYAHSAVSIDPDYRFAELMRTLVMYGTLPEWAFAGGRGGP